MSVYPRTHGETTMAHDVLVSFKGLSPYTRGNRFSSSIVPMTFGSIPVHTGKPRSNSGYADRQRVYPRTHGETLEL